MNRFKKSWALPGGLVKNDESLEQAVNRELKEEAGIDVNYLEQLYTFGKPDRDPRNRVISIAYYGLVRPKDYQISADTDAEDVAWFSIRKLPKLAFDHKHIVDVAIKRLQGRSVMNLSASNYLTRSFLSPIWRNCINHFWVMILIEEISKENNELWFPGGVG